jgi:hypothetical protein
MPPAAAARSATVGPATKSDNAALKKRAKASNVRYSDAYEKGRRGDQSDSFYDDPAEQQAYDTGSEEHKRAKGAPSPPGDGGGAGPTGKPARPGKKPASSPFSRFGGKAKKAGSSIGTEGAGAVLALAAYAVGINFLKGGTPRVRQWFAAKFLNKTAAANPAPGAAAPAPVPPVPNPTLPGSPSFPKPPGTAGGPGGGPPSATNPKA